MSSAQRYGEIDADAIRDFHTQSSPAAAPEGMTAVLPARLPLAAGAENEAPGVGIPPPRPVPPDEHFSYIQELTGRSVHVLTETEMADFSRAVDEFKTNPSGFKPHPYFEHFR